jgi:hypothetical protein
MEICSICSCKFDMENEGGVGGCLGILPFALCPMCFSGLDLMFTEIHGCYEEEEDDEG